MHPVEEQIRARLAKLSPRRLEVHDESGQHVGHAGSRPSGGTHWRLVIVSDAFGGQPVVARHRMVYEALGDLMKGQIHALKIEATPPEQS